VQIGGGAGFEAGGSPRPLATGAEVMLLRVCQEALANVRKHARARRAWVRLSYGADDFRSLSPGTRRWSLGPSATTLDARAGGNSSHK
jgi:hypothetical protein